MKDPLMPYIARALHAATHFDEHARILDRDGPDFCLQVRATCETLGWEAEEVDQRPAAAVSAALGVWTPRDEAEGTFTDSYERSRP